MKSLTLHTHGCPIGLAYGTIILLQFFFIIRTQAERSGKLFHLRVVGLALKKKTLIGLYEVGQFKACMSGARQNPAFIFACLALGFETAVCANNRKKFYNKLKVIILVFVRRTHYCR